MTHSNILSSTILAAGICIGLIGAGFLAEKAAITVKKSERYVTVKGIAERNVKANLGIWEVDYKEIGNDLPALSTKIMEDQKVVQEFLLNHGFTTAEIIIQPTRVNDLLANPYNQPNVQAQNNRYILTSGIRIRTTNVDQIFKISQMTGNLIKAGIPLNFDMSNYSSDLNPNPSYFYTQLDSIRPEMMAQATQSARAIAEQFAKDSHSQLDEIRRANQGVFQLSSRDSGSDNNTSLSEVSSIDKKVRLVTTIDYYLKG